MDWNIGSTIIVAGFIKFDFTITIVFNIIKFGMLAKFCQDKWNCALLLIKVHFHILIGISLSNWFLDLFITLEQALDLYLLLKHLLQIDHFLPDSLVLLLHLWTELSWVFKELSHGWLIFIHHWKAFPCFIFTSILFLFNFFTIFSIRWRMFLLIVSGAFFRDFVSILGLISLYNELALLWQAVIVFHIEGHRLLVLLEDITGQEDVQRVIDAPS